MATVRKINQTNKNKEKSGQIKMHRSITLVVNKIVLEGSRALYPLVEVLATYIYPQAQNTGWSFFL